MSIIFEALGEVIVEIFYYWLKDTQEKSIILFILKTVLRIAVLGVFFFLSYHLLRYGLHSSQIVFTILGGALCAFLSILLIILTYKSIRSFSREVPIE